MELPPQPDVLRTGGGRQTHQATVRMARRDDITKRDIILFVAVLVIGSALMIWLAPKAIGYFFPLDADAINIELDAGQAVVHPSVIQDRRKRRWEADGWLPRSSSA
jgi:hypothetical protein